MPTYSRPTSAKFVKDESPWSLEDALGTFADALKQQARSPNYLSYQPTTLQVPFHTSPSRRKLFIGGNRAGKTTAGLCEAIGWVSKRHRWRKEIREFDRPIRGRVICKDNDTLKMVILPKVRQWVVPSDLRNSSWEDSYVSSDRTLYLANGSTLQFKTYEQDPLSHAGMSLHFVHFDEPPPKEIYQENLLRLLDAYDDFLGSGAFWMTYTPIGGMDWAYQEIYLPGVDNPEGSGVLVIHSSVDDNPYISDEAKAALFKGMSEEQIAIRRHGKYIQLSGMVFSEWGDENTIQAEELALLWGDTLLPPADWKLYWSIDHGLHNATAIYWHAVSPDDQVITYHERHISGVLIEDHAAAVKEYEAYAIPHRYQYRTGDPAMRQRSAITGTSVIQEYAKHGIYIAVENIPRDPSIGINRMRQYMKPRLDANGHMSKPHWRVYDCPMLDRELRQLHWERYNSSKLADSRNPKESVHKYRDHGFDSCKYFFTALPNLAPDTYVETRPSPPTVGPANSFAQVVVETIWDINYDSPSNSISSNQTQWVKQDDDFGLEEFD